MPTVLFTSALQRFLPVPSAQVAGATIGEALTAVFASEPRLRGYVLDDQGALRRCRDLCQWPADRRSGAIDGSSRGR
jgi:hypothetical protein